MAHNVPLANLQKTDDILACTEPDAGILTDAQSAEILDSMSAFSDFEDPSGFFVAAIVWTKHSERRAVVHPE